MYTLETVPNVERIFSEMRDEMAAAHVRAVRRLIAIGVHVDHRVTEELEAEADELVDWVDRVRAAVGITGPVAIHAVSNRYTPENPSDRP